MPANACDPFFPPRISDIAYTYQIARYEVTNALEAQLILQALE